MAKTWVTNSGSTPKFMGGRLLQPGDGVFIDEGPYPNPRREGNVRADPDTGALVGLDGMPIDSLRATPVCIASIGPSHAHFGAGTPCDISKHVGVLGTSGTNISSERWQVNTFYPMSWLVGDGGVDGETTADILARSSKAYSATRKSIPDVLDTNPHVVIPMSMDTNDFPGLTVANYRATVARHRSILQPFIDAGVVVLEIGNFPYSASTHLNPSLTRQAIIETNAIYAADAAASGGKIEYLDSMAVLGDGTGNWRPNYSANDATPGLHCGVRGQQPLSKLIGDWLTRRFGSSAKQRYLGKNLLGNAGTSAYGSNALGLVTVAGVGGGQCPQGWAQGSNGPGSVTQNLSIQRYVNGERFFTMLATNIAAPAQQSCWFPLDAANLNGKIAAGDTGRGGKLYSYYTCRAHLQGARCSFKAARAEELDAWLLDELLDKVMDREVIQGVLDQLDGAAARWHKDHAARRTSLVLELRTVEGRRSKLYDAIEGGGRDTPGLDQMGPRLKELNDQAKRLEQSLTRLENEPEPMVGQVKVSPAEAEEVFRQTVNGCGDPKKLQAFVATITQMIVVNKDDVVVHYKPECLVMGDGTSVRSEHSWLLDLGSNQGPTD